MKLANQGDWLKTSQGDPRGYIQARGLEELWFHTGTKCNLSCPFCLEGSSPTSDRLSYLKAEECLPLMDEAVALGCQKFSFTGGEPFLNPDFLEILALGLERLPCLVLSNATKPLHLKCSELQRFKGMAHDLSFRVSIDSPDESRHDEGRGAGSFALALDGVKLLLEEGFAVSLALHWPKGTKVEDLRAEMVAVLEAHGLPKDLHMVFFPDFHEPHATVEVPEITEDCMTRYQDEVSRSQFMCAFSRMVIKRGDQLKVSACTLVDDDEDYDMASVVAGETKGHLERSLEAKVMLRHHRCFSCFSCGASCSE